MNPFFSSLKPYLWAFGVVAMIACYQLGHHKGYTLANLENTAVIGKLNEEARTAEEAHTKAVYDLAYKLTKANSDANIENSRLRSQLRAGTQRMYLPAACPVQAGASLATPTGDRNEARAELDPEAAATLLTITEDGDRAIRQLNACIDAYNDLAK
jgi:prophage endopeptidase